MFVFPKLLRHKMTDFKIWSLEIFWKIILVRSVGFLDYNLDCKGLSYEKPMAMKRHP
jgi:hypothetical protein